MGFSELNLSLTYASLFTFKKNNNARLPGKKTT